MVAGMPSPLASVPPRALTLLSPRPPAHCACVFSFFFSSRRRHTRFDCDWSSDVCSSDLLFFTILKRSGQLYAGKLGELLNPCFQDCFVLAVCLDSLPAGVGSPVRRLVEQERSEERRVGKECRGRWSQEQEKEKRTNDEAI